MGRVTCQQSISLDGFSAGPDPSLEDPLGIGGERLHEWFFRQEVEPVDAEVAKEILEPNGAYVMGRGMFGGGPGQHDPEWRGWWGEEPPYHAPVFVLTHHPREPLVLGETTFTFVTEGFDRALALAREAAGDRDVSIAGGASVAQQALRAGALDELHLHVAPVLLGGGRRFFEDVGEVALRPVEVRHSPHVTHVRYAVG